MSSTRGATSLSHARQWRRGIVQDVAPEGVYDLGPGYLEPALLPVGMLRDAYSTALSEYGAAALSYGCDAGVVPLRTALSARASMADGQPCDPDQVVITAGTSQALYLLATTLAAPKDVVLVDEQCYDFGYQILADCGLRVRRVPSDESGMDPEALRRASTGGDRPAFVYLNPTFHNPTGRVVPVERRRELLEVAAHHGVLVVEDDAYAELGLEQDALPASMAAMAAYHGVVRLCSFSKTLGPGLRLGWLLTEPAVAAKMVSHGLFVSGGCLNHTTSLAVATVLGTGDYDWHLHHLRVQLTARRDALVGGLHDGRLDHVEFSAPAGGFFLWLRVRDGLDETELVEAAALAGVRVAAGSRFGPTPGASVRLAYSFNPPELLASAAHRLAEAWSTK